MKYNRAMTEGARKLAMFQLAALKQTIEKYRQAQLDVNPQSKEEEK